MAFFKVKKWQSGTDASGNDFEWKHEDLILEASSIEELQQELSKVNGKEIYTNEYLRLRVEGECEDGPNSILANTYALEYAR
jgi:hypothetical protein